MNRLSFLTVFLVSLSFLLPGIVLSAEEGDQSPLPELILPVPADEGQRQYLGLKGPATEKFSLASLDADIVVIELFSMYCPYCQREAPLVNELHELMQATEKSRGIKVRMIGLGASNSKFEVDQFAETYDVSFPLFADKDMAMYKALGGAGTPGFVGYLLKDKEVPVNILRNSGGFYSAESFLDNLIRNSGL